MEYLSNWFKKIWLILVVAGVIIGLDQWTKELIRQQVPKFTSVAPIAALEGYFDFHHVDNYGAAFGILQNGGNIFIVIALIVAGAILVYARSLPSDQRLLRVLLGLQLGGALGNATDRINQGFVTDFIRMGIPGLYYWPNYNIADSSIVIGVISLAIYIIWEDVQRQRMASAEEQSLENLSAGEMNN